MSQEGLPGSQGPAPEDQRCNGTLHKSKSLGRAGDDTSGQRYSADPTGFLGERGSRGDTDEDGYMTPMKDKASSGTKGLHTAGPNGLSAILSTDNDLKDT